jgi:hypothetical protein
MGFRGTLQDYEEDRRREWHAERQWEIRDEDENRASPLQGVGIRGFTGGG